MKRWLWLIVGFPVAALAVTAGAVLVLTGPDSSSGSQAARSRVLASPSDAFHLPAQAPGAQPPSPGPEPTVVLEGVSRLRVPSVGIDAPIVTLGVDPDGVMQSPSTPTDVGWYNFSSVPGQGGNIVISGHVDYINYGPAVFWHLRDLKPNDLIQVVLDDSSVVTYRVTDLTTYNDASAPVQQIVGPTPAETVTLITCTGTFDAQTHSYDERLVVRAVRA